VLLHNAAKAIATSTPRDPGQLTCLISAIVAALGAVSEEEGKANLLLALGTLMWVDAEEGKIGISAASKLGVGSLLPSYSALAKLSPICKDISVLISLPS